MKRTRIIVLALMMSAMMIPTGVMADAATNESITGLSIEFTGEGENTMATISVYVNEVATENTNLTIDVWVDEKNDANILVDGGMTVSGTKTETTVIWPIATYAEGMHTLIVAFDADTMDEVSHDNEADNELSLVFGTQDATIPELIELYGSVQYFWTKSTRSTLDGALAFLDEIPVYNWILIIAIIIVAIILIRHFRKKGKLGKKSAYRTAYVPYSYAKQGYNNHRNYRNEFR